MLLHPLCRNTSTEDFKLHCSLLRAMPSQLFQFNNSNEMPIWCDCYCNNKNQKPIPRYWYGIERIIYVRYRIFEAEKFEIVLLFEKPITFLYNLTGTTVKIKRNKHVYFYKIDWYLFSQLIYCFTIYICEPLYITTILSFH